MFLDAADIVSRFSLEVGNDGVGGNPGIREIFLNEVPYLDLLFRAEVEGVATGGPDFLSVRPFPAGFLQVLFNLVQGSDAEGRILVEIAECAGIVGAPGGDFNEKAVRIGLRSDNRSMKMHNSDLLILII